MPRNKDSDAFQLIGVLLGAGIVIGGLFCLGGYLDRCQRCDKWYSKRKTDKIILKEQPAARDLDREDKRYDKNGKYQGMTKRKERVYGKNVTYDVTVECAKCGYSYHQTEIQWRDA